MIANEELLHTAREVFRKEGLSAVLREVMWKVIVVETYVAYRFDLRNPLPDLMEESPLSGPPSNGG